MSTATRELSEIELAAIDDAAYIKACETVGPNSPEFARLYERIVEEMCDAAERLVHI